MCLFCKKHKKPSKEGQDQASSVVYINFKLGDQMEDFTFLRDRLNEKMGTHITNSAVIRHSIAVTAQLYRDKTGVH